MKNLVMIVSLTIISTPSWAKTKVFGELHASYENTFAVGAKSNGDLNLNNSFLGVKGSTEIKKDVSFIYQLVWGIDSSGFENPNRIHIDNRNQVIGLASPSGAVVIGRFDTPFKTVGKKVDLFWHSQLGQNRNITNATNWDIRADKIIAFQTPRKKGFQASAAYASDIADTSKVTDNASALSMNAFYKVGKYQLGAGFEQHNLKQSLAKKQALRLSGIYRNGPLKLTGFLQKENNDNAVTAESDAIVVGVGASYRKGKGVFKGQLYTRDVDSSDKNSHLIAVGYDYRMSKKLDVYAQLARTTHTANLGGIDLDDSTIKESIKGFSLGVKYKF